MSGDPAGQSALERSIVLTGGCNFRDLGGYPAGDGRKVKWRKLFRSGVLDHLTEDDCATISRLGIGVVIDFRGNGERKQRPSKAFGAERTWVRDYAMSQADYSGPAKVATSEQRLRGMLAAYRTMLDEQAHGYRELFQTLDSTTDAVLFHCTGGKDRTGVAAALLLDILGVSRDLILEDYALTNACFVRDAAVIRAFAPSPPPELMAADHSYLHAMFARLDGEFGGAEAYVKHLGLDEAFSDRLRDKYLD